MTYYAMPCTLQLHCQDVKIHRPSSSEWGPSCCFTQGFAACKLYVCIGRVKLCSHVRGRAQISMPWEQCSAPISCALAAGPRQGNAESSLAHACWRHLKLRMAGIPLASLEPGLPRPTQAESFWRLQTPHSSAQTQGCHVQRPSAHARALHPGCQCMRLVGARQHAPNITNSCLAHPSAPVPKLGPPGPRQAGASGAY